MSQASTGRPPDFYTPELEMVDFMKAPLSYSDDYLHSSVIKAIRERHPPEDIYNVFQSKHSSWRGDPWRQCAILKKAVETEYDDLFNYLYENHAMPLHLPVCPSLLFLAASALRPQLICHMLDSGKHRYTEMFCDILQPRNSSVHNIMHPWAVAIRSKNGKLKYFLEYIIENSPNLTLDEIYGKYQDQSLVHIAAELNASEFLEYLLEMNPSCIKWCDTEGNSVLHYGVLNGIEMTKFLFQADPSILLHDNDQSFKCVCHALRKGLTPRNRHISEIPDVINFLKLNVTNLFHEDHQLLELLQIMPKSIENSLLIQRSADLEILEISLVIYQSLLESRCGRPIAKMDTLIDAWGQLSKIILGMIFKKRLFSFEQVFLLKNKKPVPFPIAGLKTVFRHLLLIGYPGHTVEMKIIAEEAITKLLGVVKKEDWQFKAEETMPRVVNVPEALSLAKFIAQEMLQRGYDLQLSKDLICSDIYFCVTPLLLNTLEQAAYSVMLPYVLDLLKSEQAKTFKATGKIWKPLRNAIQEISQGTQRLSYLCRKTIYHSMGRVLYNKVQHLELPQKVLNFMLSFD